MDTSKWPLPGRGELVNDWAVETRTASQSEHLTRALRSSTFFPLTSLELHASMPQDLQFEGPFDAKSFEDFVRCNVRGVMTHVLDPDSGFIFFSLPSTAAEGVGPFARPSSLMFSGGLAPLASPSLIRESLLFPTVGGMSPLASARSGAEWPPCELCGNLSRTRPMRACEMCGTLADLSPRHLSSPRAALDVAAISLENLPFPAPLSPLRGDTTTSTRDSDSETDSDTTDDDSSVILAAARRLSLDELAADAAIDSEGKGEGKGEGEGEVTVPPAQMSRAERRSATSRFHLLERSSNDLRIYCKGFPEGTSMLLLTQHVNAGLCRALGSVDGTSHIRGALPLATSATSCLLVSDSAQLARAALALDDALLFNNSRLTLRRPQGWRDDDFPNPLPLLRVTVVREEAGVEIGAVPVTPAAPTRRPPPAPQQSAFIGQSTFQTRAPAGVKAAKKKKSGGVSTGGSKGVGGGGGGDVALAASAGADPMMMALTPWACARIVRVRSHLKRGDLECLEQLCSREKGGMMHVSYGPLLAVLEALQAEGFLKFSARPTSTLIFSGVAGETAHNVPKPRRPSEGINSFTLQFIRRCIIDQGIPLRALLGIDGTSERLWRGSRQGSTIWAPAYANGDGVDVDKVEAVKWYKREAEQGNVLAQAILGVCYSLGTGVAVDKREAVKWLTRAAESGDADAQNYLASLHL